MTEEEIKLIDQRKTVKEEISAVFDEISPVYDKYKNAIETLRKLKFEYQDEVCQKMISDALYKIKASLMI